jgi:hypothetical protein
VAEINFNIADFKRNLDDVVKLCKMRLNSKSRPYELRTLYKSARVADSLFYEPGTTDWQRLDIALDLFQRRRQLIKHYAIENSELESYRKAGTLILHWPGGSDSSGTAMRTSKGYFDVDDCPPVDTWVYYILEPRWGSQLLAWVPPEFLKQALAGVDAEYLDCLFRFDDPELVDPKWGCACVPLLKEYGFT